MLKAMRIQKYIISLNFRHEFPNCCLNLGMGLVYLRELDSETKFALWKIEETAEELLAQLQLNEVEQAKVDAMNRGKRILHWLATRVLLRKLLNTSEYINCPSDANGKPYLPDFDYKISLTHSYEYAGLMMSARGECGIDIEIVKTKVMNIKEKFLKPEELAFITSANAIKQMYACWCAKEAVYKLQGNKGVSFLQDMTIQPFDYQKQGVLLLDLHTTDTQRTTFEVHYEEFADYMLGYVAE